MQGDFHGFQETCCGGGVRVIITLLASILIILTGFHAPADAEAATRTPASISVNCNTTDSSTTGLCRISVGYDDGTIETTEWGHDISGMDGVKLPNNVVKDSKTGYLPQVVCWREVENSCHTFALKNKPAGQTSQTVINQMPTTGAPTGLSNVGLLAVGVGLAGVVAVLIRRRRMV